MLMGETGRHALSLFTLPMTTRERDTETADALGRRAPTALPTFCSSTITSPPPEAAYIRHQEYHTCW